MMRNDSVIDENDIVADKMDAASFLGCGGFADIYRGSFIDRKNDCTIPVALKIAKRRSDDEIRYEAAMLSLCTDCPYIVRFFGHMKSSNSLVMEMGLESLYQILYKKDSLFSFFRVQIDLRLRLKLTIAFDCIRALEFLHSRLISHNDIKPDNLMLFPDGNFKLIDFGLAKPIEKACPKHSHGHKASTPPSPPSPPAVRCKGNPSYQAPEMFQSPPICSAASDIYGFAILLNEILTEQTPMHDAFSVALLPLQVCGGSRPSLVTSAHLRDAESYLSHLSEDIDPEEVTRRLQHLIRTCWDPQSKDRPLSKAASVSLRKMLDKTGGEARPFDAIAEFSKGGLDLALSPNVEPFTVKLPVSPVSVTALFG